MKALAPAGQSAPVIRILSHSPSSLRAPASTSSFDHDRLQSPSNSNLRKSGMRPQAEAPSGARSDASIMRDGAARRDRRRRTHRGAGYAVGGLDRESVHRLVREPQGEYPTPKRAARSRPAAIDVNRYVSVANCTLLHPSVSTSAPRHSHSIVPGGFDVTSYTTRLTPLTSLMMRVALSPRPVADGG